MTSKLTRERLEWLSQISGRDDIEDVDGGEIRELARAQLAAMDSEPVDIVGMTILEQAGCFNPALCEGFRESSIGRKPVENHIGSKNALDAIVSFIKSESNPTVKDYEEVSERLHRDNCQSLSSHIIEYIEKVGEELEDLRAEQADDTCRAAMLQAGNSPVIGVDLASGPDRTVEVRYVAPPGYVMVPKEPTEAMINAWLSEVANWRGHVAGYKAMLAAATQEV